MQTQICEEKLIEIFIAVDDFIKPFEHYLTQRALSDGASQPTRQPELAASEVITLLVYYGTGHPAPLRLQELPVLLPTSGNTPHEELFS